MQILIQFIRDLVFILCVLSERVDLNSSCFYSDWLCHGQSVFSSSNYKDRWQERSKLTKEINGPPLKETWFEVNYVLH